MFKEYKIMIHVQPVIPPHVCHLSLHRASVIRLPSWPLKEPQFLTAFDNIIKITLHTYSGAH